MKKVFKYKQKLVLEQNQFYHFKLHKKVKGFSGYSYLVMIDPFGNKHLVPAEYYLTYKLKVRNTYLCKVDKINCLGRIFIEPPHPYYKENETYKFRFVKTLKEKHKLGSVQLYYQFLGENKYEALFKENNSLSEHLKTGIHSFRIKKISKGKVFIDYC